MTLREGQRYRIRYKCQSGNYRWYEWEAVITYLGLGGPSGDELFFHGRPEFDTGRIPPKDLVSAELVDKSVPHKHPRQLKGAVEEPRFK